MKPLYHHFPIVLDNTQVVAFKRCPISWFYNYCLHLAEEKSVHLHFGGAFAAGLETARTAFYLQEQSADDALEAGQQRITDFWGDPALFQDTTKNYEACHTLLELYFMKFPMAEDIYKPVIIDVDGKEEVGVEFDFLEALDIEHPYLPTSLYYAGRADMLTNSPHFGKDSLLVFDDKTTGSYITPFLRESWETRGQFSGYSWGLLKAGYKARGAVISLASITKSSVEFERIESARTSFQLENWERDMRNRVKSMVEYYETMVEEHRKNPKAVVPQLSPLSALDESCQMFYRHCYYTQCCTMPIGESVRLMGANQHIWLPHKQCRVSLQQHMEDLELNLDDYIWTETNDAEVLVW